MLNGNTSFNVDAATCKTTFGAATCKIIFDAAICKIDWVAHHVLDAVQLQPGLELWERKTFKCLCQKGINFKNESFLYNFCCNLQFLP